MSNTFENQLLYDVRQKRVRRIKNQLTTNLTRLGEQTSFAVGEGLHVCGEGYSLLLRCVHLDDEHFCYGGTLMVGFPIGEEVEGIGWSIVNSAGQSIASGTTRPGGHFAFDLPTSTHRRGEPMQLRIGQAVAPSLGERAETTRMEETVADAVAGAGEATTDVQQPTAAWLGTAVSMEFAETLSLATTKTYATASGRNDQFWQEGDYITLNCSKKDIPSGLVRLELEESDGTRTIYYPTLWRDGDRWSFRGLIGEMLGRRPHSKKVEVCPIAATAENREEFDTERVRNIVAGWPASEQKQLAESFLGREGEVNGQ